jgi:hypothetical protein
LNKDIENIKGKTQTEILEIKNPYTQTKHGVERPFQQTRTSGRQNLRDQR